MIKKQDTNEQLVDDPKTFQRNTYEANRLLLLLRHKNVLLNVV